jgi:uncharacterized membrane protein YqjE
LKVRLCEEGFLRTLNNVVGVIVMLLAALTWVAVFVLVIVAYIPSLGWSILLLTKASLLVNKLGYAFFGLGWNGRKY